MKNKYKVRVNKNFEFELNLESLKHLDVVEQNNSKYHILDQCKAIKATLIQKDFDQKKYTISINSNTYHIEIANTLDQRIQAMGYTTGASKKMDFIKAPMPGIIIQLNIKVGDKVKEGDILLVLEAMKMENAITCPKNAIVKSINAKVGETVEKNKLIIEFE